MLHNHWSKRPIKDRAGAIYRAVAIIPDEQQALATTLTRGMGKLVGQPIGELHLSAAILGYYTDTVAGFLTPKVLPDSPGATLHAQPLGIVLADEPWNLPLFQLARVVGPQPMVGKIVIAKPVSNVLSLSNPSCGVQSFPTVPMRTFL